ncbi:MAG: radical SAM protein [Chloroflexota bacterium]
MDVESKLDMLVADARFDACGYGGKRHASSSPLRFITRAALPGGGTVCLFKVLLTNACINDCAYCVNQVGRDRPRSSFRPEDLAALFMELYNKGLAQGLFLSSGVAGNASRTMEQMLNTVEILRHHYEFRGYVHLKVMPGASFDCVAEACRLANRVSVNMEAPTPQHLARLSSKKDLYRDILERMRWVKRVIAGNDRAAPSGQTTQFVVGASGETDRDILHAMEMLYREMDLRRAYFSAFQPVGDSRLEGHPPAPPMREHRLYQTDWLLRVYGFPLQEVELALGQGDSFSLAKEPKLVMARRQPWRFPVDVNRASHDELLRVPGVGPRSAKRIAEARREHSIFSLGQLEKMGVRARLAAPFIRFQGISAEERQLALLPEDGDGLAREAPPLVVPAATTRRP